MSGQDPPACMAMTCVDGLDHLVPEAVVARTATGLYTARCGSVVIPEAMSAPAGQHCPLCWVSHQARARS